MKKEISVLFVSALVISTLCGYSNNAKRVEKIESKKKQIESYCRNEEVIAEISDDITTATDTDAELTIEVNQPLILKDSNPYYPTEVIIAASENGYELPGVIISEPYAVYDLETPKVNGPMSEHLTKQSGVFYGPSGKETYYNLNMSKCISIMRELGYSEEEYPYWIREDGAKMLGDYVMVAADLSIRPKGTILETSLGTAIVVDTGSFTKYDSMMLDIACAW